MLRAAPVNTLTMLNANLIKPTTRHTHAIKTRLRHLRKLPRAARLPAYLLTAAVLLTTVAKLSKKLVLMPAAASLFDTAIQPHAHEQPPRINAPATLSTYSIGALPKHRRTELRKRRHALQYDRLPLLRPEVDLILSYLHPQTVLLNFGSRSPVIVRTFATFVNFTVSVHTGQAPCNHVGRSPTVRFVCTGMRDGLEDDYKRFESYAEAPRRQFAHLRFDAVFINGHARLATALTILPQLKPTSLLFFHDYFERPLHYQRVLYFYEEVARILPYSHMHAERKQQKRDGQAMHMGLLILRPKGNHTYVPPEQIQHWYEEDKSRPVEGVTTAGIEASFLTKGLNKSNEGGFEYYKLSRQMSQRTSRVRLLLDIIMLPIVWLGVHMLQGLWHVFFYEMTTTTTSPLPAVPL